MGTVSLCSILFYLLQLFVPCRCLYLDPNSAFMPFSLWVTCPIYRNLTSLIDVLSRSARSKRKPLTRFSVFRISRVFLTRRIHSVHSDSLILRALDVIFV